MSKQYLSFIQMYYSEETFTVTDIRNNEFQAHFATIRVMYNDYTSHQYNESYGVSQDSEIEEQWDFSEHHFHVNIYNDLGVRQRILTPVYCVFENKIEEVRLVPLQNTKIIALALLIDGEYYLVKIDSNREYLKYFDIINGKLVCDEKEPFVIVSDMDECDLTINIQSNVTPVLVDMEEVSIGSVVMMPDKNYLCIGKNQLINGKYKNRFIEYRGGLYLSLSCEMIEPHANVGFWEMMTTDERIEYISNPDNFDDGIIFIQGQYAYSKNGKRYINNSQWHISNSNRINMYVETMTRYNAVVFTKEMCCFGIIPDVYNQDELSNIIDGNGEFSIDMFKSSSDELRFPKLSKRYNDFEKYLLEKG